MSGPERIGNHGENPFIDYWGEPYMSPTKMKREMRKNSMRQREKLKAGPLFKSLHSVLFNILRISPKTLATMDFILLNFLAVGRILLNIFVAFMNPIDNLVFDKSWPSVNLLSGAIFIPKFDVSKAFPFWLNPKGIRRFEWNAIRILISFSKGVHIAIDVEKLNLGFIIEEVVRDRTKHRSKAHLDVDTGYDTHNVEGSESNQRSEMSRTPEHIRDARKKKYAKKKVEHFSVAFRTIMEKLKCYGINIALNFDEIGVGLDYVKLELDGTITRSDDWWSQGTHVRALDVGMTLSTGKSASFVSWEVLELRFLEEESSDSEESDVDSDTHGDDDDDGNGFADGYFHLAPVDGPRNNSLGSSGSGAEVAAADNDEELIQTQRDIARQLFDECSETNSATAGAAGADTKRALVRRTNGDRKRSKDSFARALEAPPLLSLSSFSCGANVFLELTQMDFSSRSAMMSRYGEIKRLYRSSNEYSASGPVGTSASAHFARRKHQHIRGEIPGGSEPGQGLQEDEQEMGAADSLALSDTRRRWGMTMSAVAVSVFYAYAKAKAAR